MGAGNRARLRSAKGRKRRRADSLAVVRRAWVGEGMLDERRAHELSQPGVKKSQKVTEAKRKKAKPVQLERLWRCQPPGQLFFSARVPRTAHAKLCRATVLPLRGTGLARLGACWWDLPGHASMRGTRYMQHLKNGRNERVTPRKSGAFAPSRARPRPRLPVH